MKKILIIFMLCSVLLYLSGCGSYSEIHEISFVISLGFDYDLETKEYEVSTYVINNANLTQNQNQSTDTSSYIGVYKDKSITNALKKITSNVDITLEFKHIKTIFLNVNFLIPEHMEYIYTYFKNGPLFYPNFEIYITPNKIKDIFSVQVFEETTLFYTLMTGDKKAHFHKTITFFELCNDKLIKGFFLGYPVVEVKTDVFEDQEKNYHTTEIIGSMYFDEQLNGLLIKYQEYPGIYLIHNVNNLMLHINDIEFLIDNYTFQIVIDKNEEHNVNLHINAEIGYIYSPNYDLNEYKEILKKYIAEEIDKVYNLCLANNIDMFNINYLRYLNRLKEINLHKVKLNYNINLITP